MQIVYLKILNLTGIDSRFGFGFRLGPHADFQTVVELGPQTNTNPISANGTVAKRQSLATPNRIQRVFNEISKNAGVRVQKNTEKKKLEKPQQKSAIDTEKQILEKAGNKKNTEKNTAKPNVEKPIEKKDIEKDTQKKSIQQDVEKKTLDKEKKSQKIVSGKVEFKKVPGLDDFKDSKIKHPRNLKFNSESPTKFVLL